MLVSVSPPRVGSVALPPPAILAITVMLATDRRRTGELGTTQATLYPGYTAGAPPGHGNTVTQPGCGPGPVRGIGGNLGSPLAVLPLLFKKEDLTVQVHTRR